MKRVSFFVLLVFSIGIALCGCNKEDTTHIWGSIYELPDGISEKRIISLDKRQQTVYGNEDNSIHIILEIMKENSDIIPAEETEVLENGGNTIKSYSYTGDKIEYSNINDVEIGGLYKPQMGDIIIEWKTKGMYIRLFGNMERRDLIYLTDKVTVEK